MSNRRAAIRREQKEREKIMKDKSKAGELKRLQYISWENGKIIGFTTMLDALYSEFGWKKEQLVEFLENARTQSIETDPDVLEFAAVPWHRKLEDAIQKRTGEIVENITATTILQGMGNQQRNLSFVRSCSFFLLNLFSNYGMSSNGKGTGKLDRIIEICAIHFQDLLRNPADYTNEKCVQRTERLTGVRVG